MPDFDHGTCYASATHSDQQQGLTNVQAPESGYAGPELSECNTMST